MSAMPARTTTAARVSAASGETRQSQPKVNTTAAPRRAPYATEPGTKMSSARNAVRFRPTRQRTARSSVTASTTAMKAQSITSTYSA
jgi:hypothetical protein